MQITINKKSDKMLVLIACMLLALTVALCSVNIKLTILLVGTIGVMVCCYKPKLFIYLMMTYVTFEVVILNFIPTSAVGIVRYGTEGVAYIVLMYSIFVSIIKKKEIKLNKCDFFIISFILFSIITALINHVSIQIFIMGLRWIIRYVVIYFIFKFNKFNDKDLKEIIDYFYKLVIFEVVLGLMQVGLKDKLDFILSPKTIDLEFYTITMDKINSKFSIFATFGRYGEYGYFVTLAMLFLYSKYYFERKNKYLFLMVLTSLALLFSYARQAVLAVIITLVIFYFSNRKIKILSKFKVIIILVSFMLLGLVFLYYSGFETGQGVTTEGIAQRFLSMFSKEYIMGDYYGGGRTYFYTTVNKIFLETKPFIGYGVGMYGTQSAIQYDTSVYDTLLIPIRCSMDVYVTSILGQVGLIGLFLLFKCYHSFFKVCKKYQYSSNDNYIFMFIRLTFIAIMFCSFFGSNLSDRYQAFYVWMFFGILDNKINNLNNGNSIAQ